MVRFGLVVLICLLTLPVHAQGDERRKRAEQIRELRADWRELERTRGFSLDQDKARAILKRAADIEDDRAEDFLIERGREPRLAPLLGEIVEMLERRRTNTGAATAFMKTLLAPDHPERRSARAYLIKRATDADGIAWMRSLFDQGTVDDRFHVIRALGRIGNPQVLELAWILLEDPEWQPAPEDRITCATIAESLKAYEGAAAARNLLLLRRDPRFREEDAEGVREATRLWSRRDLRSYIEMRDLAAPDAGVRAEAATFMGRAGIEAARAPLLRLARNRSEPPGVRAAAAEALGHLRIARGALARDLADLLGATDPTVRGGVIAGLGLLRVREAAEILAGLAGGPDGPVARDALSRMSGLAPDTDWTKWLSGESCGLANGT
jgi:HEAT repeat protein